jgi:DNA-binding LacI/PurR family transcriptional regulator
LTSLRDVAELAGVSLATASRVASGAGGVRRSTRERVEQAMRELLYVPRRNGAAAGAIGLLVPELGNPIFPALAQAMEARATALGLACILCNTRESSTAEAGYVHMLLERGVDGMIFISSEIADLDADHSHYARLLEEGARLVFVNGSSDRLDVPSVGVDERAAGLLATQHLLELGHHRIGFVAGPPHFLPTQEKAAGRLAALASAGLGADGLVAHGEFGVDGGREATRELLRRPRSERPTAVICSSDLMAIGALQAAAAEGVAVPDELSVTGFDGIEATAWTQPTLTTLEQPIFEIARTAVNALHTLREDPQRPLPSYVFRPRLRLGGSTAAPPRS